MPYSRPTLSQLRQGVAQDINSALPGADALLRFSNLGIIGKALAYLANLFFGYLDYIALQAVPWTATDEYMFAWGALRKVFQLDATQADGEITFSCTGTKTVPSGTVVKRGDGVQYVSTADATGTGTIVVPAEADADPTGQTGAFGNCDIGTQMTLGSAISGVQSTGAVSAAFTGGADIETPDNYHTRMIQAYQTIQGAGTPAEFVGWAREVNGVTRAWAKANAMGSGTVVVYTMFDQVRSAFGGFPQGTNGVASGENRDTPATGDQLLVANHIYPVQGATPLVYSVAPTPDTINFTLSGLGVVAPGSALDLAIKAALDDVFLRLASAVGGTMRVQDYEDAIGSVPAAQGFVLNAPNANHTSVVGQLPVCGTVSYV